MSRKNNLAGAVTAGRPVQLQANLNGAWKTILHFDAGDSAAADRVEQGITLLYEASSATSYRIASCDKLPLVLRHLGKSTYGIWMNAKEHQQ